MDIGKKIEEIRQQPENIRLRYVWGAVAISMLFIIAIWIVSLKANRINNINNQPKSICSPGENCFENNNSTKQLQSDIQQQIKF